MKVISFKVDDEVYLALRKKNLCFRAIFEPIAIELSQNLSCRTQYTDGIRKRNCELYSDVSEIHRIATKILKSGGKR